MANESKHAFYVLLYLTGYINTARYLWGQCWYFLAVTLFSSENFPALTRDNQNCEFFLPLQINNANTIHVLGNVHYKMFVVF